MINRYISQIINNTDPTLPNILDALILSKNSWNQVPSSVIVN